jgi:hypothetical protein
MLGGFFMFGSADAALLVSLLPAQIHIRKVPRLAQLVGLVAEEATAQRAGHDLLLTKLVEVLLIEALRSSSNGDAPPGLLRGLADTRLSVAMRHLHDDPAHAWTVAEPAQKAALSRSSQHGVQPLCGTAAQP